MVLEEGVGDAVAVVEEADAGGGGQARHGLPEGPLDLRRVELPEPARGRNVQQHHGDAAAAAALEGALERAQAPAPQAVAVEPRAHAGHALQRALVGLRRGREAGRAGRRDRERVCSRGRAGRRQREVGGRAPHQPAEQLLAVHVDGQQARRQHLARPTALQDLGRPRGEVAPGEEARGVVVEPVGRRRERLGADLQDHQRGPPALGEDPLQQVVGRDRVPGQDAALEHRRRVAPVPLAQGAPQLAHVDVAQARASEQQRVGARAQAARPAEHLPALGEAHARRRAVQQQPHPELPEHEQGAGGPQDGARAQRVGAGRHARAPPRTGSR